MNVTTSVRFKGDYSSGGDVSAVVFHTGYDLLGSGFGNNMLADEVSTDSIGHHLASSGTLAAMSELSVDVSGYTGLADWAGTLLFV